MESKKIKRIGYEYIWSPEIKNKDKIKYEISKKISPYLEINREFINTNNKFEEIIEVNPYIRFNEIFDEFTNYFINIDNNKNLVKIKKEIENELFYYLREIDFLNGMTILDVYCEKIENEIENEYFGYEISKQFLKLDKLQKRMLSNIIYNSIKLELEGIESFDKGLKIFFKDYIIYKNKNNDYQLIIYINRKKNKENKNLVNLLEKLFIPVGISVKYFWENHFGVLDLEEVMKVERVSIF